jgi:hypothetical protein
LTIISNRVDQRKAHGRRVRHGMHSPVPTGSSSRHSQRLSDRDSFSTPVSEPGKVSRMKEAV